MADAHPANSLAALIDRLFDRLLAEWQALQSGPATAWSGAAELREQSGRLLQEMREALLSGTDDIAAAGWSGARDLLADIARTRALQGATSSQTASFVLSLKQPLFELLRREPGATANRIADGLWAATALLDKLGLYTMEVFQKSREEVIARQQQELMELSTPVVELWEGILALPLIGTLDSQRTQVVMENLLQRIVDSEAEIAIIDITGVPTVDTLVAQHLIKTVSAARLMGADCIISGIRPQIAQTIVHLGLELDVVSKATMADAFALALRRVGKTVVARGNGAAPPPRAGAAEQPG
jgi:rsbT co-antagonist protein RsbR